MTVVELTEEKFPQTVLDNDIVLVDFWAQWCGPCLQFAPVFEEISNKHTDVVFGKINTEVEQNLAAAAQIQAIPTLMAFKSGKLVYNQAGALPASSLEDLIVLIRDYQVQPDDAEEQ